MTVSVFDLFSIGIGPPSSHTVGPMRAAHTFAAGLAADGLLDQVLRVKAELFGSLGATGHGHGSASAVTLGLQGERAETVDTRLARPSSVRYAAPGGPSWPGGGTSASPSATISCCTDGARCPSTRTGLFGVGHQYEPGRVPVTGPARLSRSRCG
ncbi:serine dehydratase beta chain [Streptomyces sparsogenes]|uniref:serine dehydratase beta chain n=1 Tax=Streptomyces sparsogenes TaxID=67365 RepID=UPI003F4D4465